MAEPDWRGLIDAWDRQQAAYLPHRERRFAAMVDAVRVVIGDRPLALDFACGPGSISERLLGRLPGARGVAIDLDPVLLAVGKAALGTMDGRLRWVEGDLSSEDWTDLVGDEAFDAVLSTTAVRWLTPPELARVYRQIAAVVRPGGIVLIADNMPFDRPKRVLRRLVSTLEQERQQRAFAGEGVHDWERWWDLVAAKPELAELVAERRHRFAQRTPRPADPEARGSRGAGAARWQRRDGRRARRCAECCRVHGCRRDLAGPRRPRASGSPLTDRRRERSPGVRESRLRAQVGE